MILRYAKILKATSQRISQGWVGQSWHICTGNRWQHSASQPTSIEKPYYVTSPIFYINAAPHVGHLYTLVLTDILKRWHALSGKKAILCTGTDEHGMKIQRAAAKAGKDVRSFCDDAYKPFEDLARAIEVDSDHFIRTSEPDHRFAVQHFWLMLKKRDWIYEEKHEGWYSVSDETFYPESTVRLALDPATGRKFKASMETGSEVEWTSETNYHFRMSELQKPLLDFYANNPHFVVPETRMKSVVQEVSAGLQDLSISRPVERLSWGIPVPDDDTQTIYVWLDALVNYLTKANYPMQIPGQEHAAGWPADCHVIGKDIVRFHCIYWPAFLIALKLPLPKQILTHAHWTLGRQKMSKSKGIVVNPFFAINRFGPDCMRYYLALDGGIKDDAMYDNSFIIDRYKKGLQGGLGNLVSRIVRGKGWNVRRAVLNCQKVVEQMDKAGADAGPLCWRLEILPKETARIMEKPDPGEALAHIMQAVYRTNAFIQSSAPWNLTGAKDQERLDRIIYICSESIRICGILLQPYMPSKMKQLLDMLGVADNARMCANAAIGSDGNYGSPRNPLEIGSNGILFPQLSSEF